MSEASFTEEVRFWAARVVRIQNRRRPDGVAGKKSLDLRLPDLARVLAK
jgi:hypothetical protein